MKKSIILFIGNYINLTNYSFFRKLKGGYWERWYIDCIHSDLWFERTYEQIKKRERPGCGFGTPYCEYYSVNMFGYLSEKDYYNFDRIRKLKRVLKKKR